MCETIGGARPIARPPRSSVSAGCRHLSKDVSPPRHDLCRLGNEGVTVPRGPTNMALGSTGRWREPPCRRGRLRKAIQIERAFLYRPHVSRDQRVEGKPFVVKVPAEVAFVKAALDRLNRPTSSFMGQREQRGDFENARRGWLASSEPLGRVGAETDLDRPILPDRANEVNRSVHAAWASSLSAAASSSVSQEMLSPSRIAASLR